MLQKNSFLQFFTSCYTTQRQQNVLLPACIKLGSKPIKYGQKISLKKGRHQSFQQVNKLNSTAQLPSKASIQLKPQKLNIRQNQLEDCLPVTSNKSHRINMKELPKLNETTIKVNQFPPTKKFVQFHYQSNTKKQVNSLQFQKTTKKMFSSDKENGFFYRPSENVRQIQEINKEKFISNLDNYKESLVSITLEMGTNQPQLQQSRIEVDFFNPSNSKLMEFEKCLHDRQ